MKKKDVELQTKQIQGPTVQLSHQTDMAPTKPQLLAEFQELFKLK